jgi:hypothetical protein
MSADRLRLILTTIWLCTSLYIATGIRLSWTTGAILFAVGLVPPIALFALWNHAGPLFNGTSRDPRSS